MRLEKEALDRLRAARIYAQTGVSLEHQILAKKHVLRGVESGGAHQDLGHFVAYTGLVGEPLSWLNPLNVIAPNGLHAIAIAPALLRFEMFRVERTYRLSITKHTIQGEPGKRPNLVSQQLFLSLEGYLALDLANKENRAVAGYIVPQFYSRSGEELTLPDPLAAWIATLTSAVTCIDCRHTHFAVPRPAVPVALDESQPLIQQVFAAAVA